MNESDHVGSGPVQIDRITKNQENNKGDINNDNNITAQDASLVLQYVLNPKSIADINTNNENADMDNDNSITSNDVALILNSVIKGILF